MIKLYGHEVSGNSYKVKLLLELLKIEYEWIKVDLMKGEQKSPEYLALNPFGQLPFLIDGKINVDAYPNVLSWIDSLTETLRERIKQLPGYVPMTGI